MIINSLNIYGFGKLSDVTIELNDGINIIEGKNEAGKSTIMAFIRGVLFGFENRTKIHLRYEPLRGGDFGGVITLTDQKGELYRIERIYGAKSKVSGDVNITLPNGEVVGDEYLPYLLGKINENIFKQIYCFGLTELQQITLLKDSQINDFIYHAGTGSVNQILKMKKSLDDSKKSLYAPRAKTAKVNILLTEIDVISDSIRTLKEKNSNYDIFLEQIEKFEQEIREYEEKSEVIKTELNKLNILERSCGSYNQMKRAEIALTEYPNDFKFPDNGINRINDILNNIQKLKLEYTELVDKLETFKGKLKELPDVDFYLDNKDLIINTKDQFNTYFQQIKSKQSLINQLQKNEDNINENLKQIGSDYPEDKIRNIEITIQDKQYIQEQAYVIEEKQKLIDDLDKKIENNNDSSYKLNNLIEEMNKEQTTEEVKDNNKIKDIFPNIKKYWEGLRENEQKRIIKIEQKHDYQRQLKSMNSKSSLASFFIINGLTLIGAILIIFFLEMPLFGSLLLVANIVITLSFRIYKKSINKSYEKSINDNLNNLDNQIGKLDKEILAVKDMANKLLNSIGFDELNETTILKLEELEKTNFKEEMLKLGEQKRIKEYQKELKYNQIDLALLEEKKNIVIEEINKLQGSLDRWLVTKNLPTDISIKNLNNLIIIIEKLKELYIARDGFQSEITDLNKYREEFENRVNNLLETNNILLNTTIESKVNYLIEQLKAVEEAKISNAHNNERFEELNERINGNIKANQQEEEKYQELLTYANVKDKEEFYKLDEKFKAYNKLQEERQQHSITIQSMGINEYNYEQILNDLENANIEDLNLKIAQSNEQLKEISENIKEKSVLKGEAQNKVNELETESLLSKQNQEYDMHTTELKNMAKDWLALTLSESILENTMKIYETEKQPELIQNTSRFFSEMTGNDYIKVSSSMVHNDISVTNKDHVVVEPQYLSRGTVEQLFLAVRYALVEEYSKQNRLPIILDDIFVNFDADRFYNSIKTLESLANNNQIIIFTCHTHQAQKIKEVTQELTYINLS